MPLFLKILKEQTPLQDDVAREWQTSLRTAWWKEEALAGVELLTGSRFDYSPDATPIQQVQSIGQIEAWWDEHKVECWQDVADYDDPAVVLRIQQLILALGTFQLRNVDNALFLLEKMGPPVAPFLFAALADSCFPIRRHCLEVLERLMPLLPYPEKARWIRKLEALLEDENPRIRERAVVTIGAAQIPIARDLLTAALEKEHAVAESALMSLSRYETPEARQVLEEFAEDLVPEHALWLPTQAARLACGDLTPLELFLQELARQDAGGSRAALYLAWIVEVDELATADDRAAAVERIGQQIRQRVLGKGLVPESSNP
jgi:hypothetical protein